MLGEVLRIELLWVPCHIKEELNGIFHRLQIADIHDPHLIDTIGIGQVHLFPDTGNGTDIDPLGVTGSTHIVEMVIHAKSALALLAAKCRQASHVTPVVITEQQRHVIGYLHALVVEILHFLIEGPHLWCLRGRFTCHVTDQLALVLHDILHQFHGGMIFHLGVTVTTHTDGVHRLPAFGTFHATTPEVEHLVFVVLEAPGAVPLATLPVLLGQSHRLMVRGAHHDTHLVGQRSVVLVIVIEGTLPHGGPQVVAFQTEQQFKHLLVTFRIDATKLLVGPVAKGGPLVVDEDATIGHLRLAIGIYTFLNIYILMLCYRNVSPPVPGRHADLAAQLIDAVDGATFVAAGNHQCLTDTSHWVVDHLKQIFFCLAFQIAPLNLATLDQLLNQLRLQAADDHTLVGGLLAQGGSGATDSLQVVLKVCQGHLHTLVVIGIADKV